MSFICGNFPFDRETTPKTSTMKKLLFLLLTSISVTAFSQKTSPYEKFGKVTKDDLDKQIYPIDSNASAVVLAHFGQTAVEGNNDASFSLRTGIHKITHILGEKGYKEADVEIPLYGSGRNAEAVKSFKAVTYNLENGKVVQSKLSSSAIVRERIDEDHSVAKFTMPNVRKGSIIEYSYDVVSPYISQPDPWYFQSLTTPTLWSEFKFEVPQFFNYRFFFRGFLPLSINESSKKEKNFRVSDSHTALATESASFVANVLYNRWVVENAPELKTEPYTKSIRNHIGRVEFQLVSQQDPLSRRSYTRTWTEIAKGMLESENFGKNLSTGNNWLRDELKQIVGDEKDPLEKAKKVYRYVRDDFKTTGQGGLYMSDNLKSVFKARQGNVTEINVLLTAMLRYVDLDAKPLMLSTSAHGYALEMVPMISSMNYVICGLTVNNRHFYLDASQRKIGFGKLPQYCYNGLAITIDDIATPVELQSDELEDNATLLYLFANTGTGYNGSITKKKGYYTSLDIRDDFNDKTSDKMTEDLKKSYGDLFELTDFKVDSLNNYEVPVNISYNLKMNDAGEDVIYFNPYLGENFTKNPFASANRSYPVEFPYRTSEVIRGSFEVPKGYQVDEMPKPIKVLLDDDGKSYFEYRIAISGERISFVSDFKISKTLFMPDEYYTLRAFFDYVVKKQSEQIVFKKIAQ